MALLRNSRPHLSFPTHHVRGWVEVKERGVVAFMGLALVGLIFWGAGFAVVKAAVAALAVLAQPAMAGLLPQASAKLLWAVADGLAVGLLALFLQRAWLGFRRRNSHSGPRVAPQATPMLAAGIAAGLMALALNVGALPTAIVSGGELDLTTGVPALLESAHLLSLVVGAGGGGGGPYPDVLAGWGVLIALFVMLIIGSAVIGGLIGGGLGAVGLGALSGAVEGATSGFSKNSRTGAMASATSGAASGALVGVVAATLSSHLTCAFSKAQHWAAFILFDIVATITAAIVILLCRRSWENPKGLIGNVLEASKVLIVLIQCALGLALVGVILAGVSFLLKWIFN